MNIGKIDILCKYQQDWITDPAGVAIGEKSRRIGFTYAVAVGETTARGGRDPVNFDYWHSSADQTAALEFIEECVGVAEAFNVVAKFSGEPEIVDEKNGVSAFVLRMGNGTKIVGGSSNPKFFRSKGGAVGLDEFAFHQDARQLYKAALASARFWGYPMRIWSTHNGPASFFNGLLGQARGGKLRASVHRVTILDAVEQGIVERIRMRRDRLTDVPAPVQELRDEWLAGLRAECPDEDTWNEEFLCIPSTDAGAFLDYDLLRGCEEPNLELWDLPTDDAQWPADREIYVGVDVAPKNDLFVIFALDKIGDVYWTRLCRARQGITFGEMEAEIGRVMGCPSVVRCCLDATSIGAQLAERMVQKFGHRIEPVQFTAPMKLDLAMPFRRLIEDRRFRMPADDKLREDLHSVRKLVTAAGNIRFDVDRSDTDGHGDRFWAATLAYHGAEARGGRLPAPLATIPEDLW